MGNLIELFNSAKMVEALADNAPKFRVITAAAPARDTRSIAEAAQTARTRVQNLPGFLWKSSGINPAGNYSTQPNFNIEVNIPTQKSASSNTIDATINRIVKGGYATDPSYRNNLKRVIESLPNLSGDKKEFYNKAYSVYRGKGLDEATAVVYAALDCLESGYGKHVSGKNNYGGIKGKTGSTRSTTEYRNGKQTLEKASFRDFASYEDYANYKINLLNKPRYNQAKNGGILYKYLTGGFIDTLDASLDKLGPWGKLGVLVVDPTGISNWKDVKNTLKAFLKEGTLAKAGEFSLAALGAIPMVGVFKSVAKLPSKLLGRASKVAESALVKTLLDVEKELPKHIINKMSSELREAAVTLINKEIENIVQDFSKQSAGKLTPELETAISKLNDKTIALGGQPVDIEAINKVLLLDSVM